MTRLPPQKWLHDGTTYTVSIFVDGDQVVGMTHVMAEEGVVVPSKHGQKYAGDILANGFAKLGVKPCTGCNKRKRFFNAADRAIRKLVGIG